MCPGRRLEYQPGHSSAYCQSGLARRQRRQQWRLHHLSVDNWHGQPAGPGFVVLNAGSVLSDAAPSVMPTLANMATLLAPYDQTVTAANEATATLLPSFQQIGEPTSGTTYVGKTIYLGGRIFSPDRIPFI